MLKRILCLFLAVLASAAITSLHIEDDQGTITFGQFGDVTLYRVDTNTLATHNNIQALAIHTGLVNATSVKATTVTADVLRDSNNAAYITTSVAANTAITGTGTLTSGGIANGFGVISTTNSITTTSFVSADSLTIAGSAQVGNNDVLTTASTSAPSLTTTGALSAGSIASGFGSISTANDISTSATLTAATLTITGSTATVNGNAVLTSASTSATNLISVGSLSSGSIANGFGSIQTANSISTSNTVTANNVVTNAVTIQTTDVLTLLQNLTAEIAQLKAQVAALSSGGAGGGSSNTNTNGTKLIMKTYCPMGRNNALPWGSTSFQQGCCDDLCVPPLCPTGFTQVDLLGPLMDTFVRTPLACANLNPAFYAVSLSHRERICQSSQYSVGYYAIGSSGSLSQYGLPGDQSAPPACGDGYIDPLHGSAGTRPYAISMSDQDGCAQPVHYWGAESYRWCVK